jgi:hypothetical protein
MLPTQDQMYSVVLTSLACVTPQRLTRSEIRSKLIAWFSITPNELHLQKQNGDELLMGRLAFVLHALEVSGYANRIKSTDDWCLTQSGLLYLLTYQEHTRQTVAQSSVDYAMIAHHRVVENVCPPVDINIKLSHLQRINAFRTEMEHRENGNPCNEHWDAKCPLPKQTELEHEFILPNDQVTAKLNAIFLT